MSPHDTGSVSPELTPRLGHDPGAAIDAFGGQDVRQAVENAIRRGWIEMARRIVRVLVLCVTDVLAAWFAAKVVLSSTVWSGAFGSIPTQWSNIIMVLCVQPLALAVTGAYRAGEHRVSFTRVFSGLVLCLGVVGVQGFLAGELHRGLVAEASGLFLYLIWASVVIATVRLIIDRGVSVAYAFGAGRRRALVVGSEEELRGVEEMLRDRNGADLRLIGRLSPTFEREPGAIHTISDLNLALSSTDARELIVASSKLSFEALETLIHRCLSAGVSVSLAPKTLHLMGVQFEPRKVRGGTLLRLQPIGLGFPHLAMKRAVDLVLSVLALLVTWPLFILIALAIKLDSRGPVFFSQTRTGVGARPFRMYKFRTMVSNADALKADLEHLNECPDPRLFKIRNDPRVTRLGRFLRRTSLDELPQFLNVLRGDMSLVGPRPPLPREVALYEPHHYSRLAVVPGITGSWQVRGRSDLSDFEEVVRLDREYIEGWSMWLDFKILLLTIPTVMRRTGAF